MKKIEELFCMPTLIWDALETYLDMNMGIKINNCDCWTLGIQNMYSVQ